VRWTSIVAAQGVAVAPWTAFRVYAASLYLGVVTPGHIGDFAKSFYLTGGGMSAGKAIFNSLADRLFDFLFLVLFGYASLLFFPGIFRNQLLTSSLILGLVVILVLALLFRREFLKRFARRFISGMPATRLRESLDRAISESIGDFGLLTPHLVAKATLLTVLAWMCHYGFFVVFAGALGVGISIPILLVSVSIAVFVALIPVSMAGLGTRDLVLILVFSRVGLTREAAVTFSFSFVLVYLIQGLVGLLCWLTVPLLSKDVADPAVEQEHA
jgi:uncharacterized protein (TIRG00374 family)